MLDRETRSVSIEPRTCQEILAAARNLARGGLRTLGFPRIVMASRPIVMHAIRSRDYSEIVPRYEFIDVSNGPESAAHPTRQTAIRQVSTVVRRVRFRRSEVGRTCFREEFLV